jgi:DNA ligase-1
MPARRLLPAFVFLVLLQGEPALAVDPVPPPPMLATSDAAGIDIHDWWVSEKLDGVRGHWDGARLWTRGGHRVRTPDWFTEGWPDTPLDGELWMGRGRFERTSALVRSRDTGTNTDWRAVRFMAFDLPDHKGAFGARLMRLREVVDRADVPWLRVVAQERLATRAALDARLTAVEARGGEGLMLHHRDARYRPGRSDLLVKYKRHDDAEARVVAHLPGQGKYTGMTGSLLVESPDGRRFRLGSGLSDAERADPPPIGAWVTYRHDGVTSKGLPRFARFIRVRHGWTPGSPE